MSAALGQLLAEKGENGKPNRRLLVEAMLEAALSGNVSAQGMILERLDGAPKGSAIAVNVDNRRVEIIVQSEQEKELVTRLLDSDGMPALEKP